MSCGRNIIGGCLAAPDVPDAGLSAEDPCGILGLQFIKQALFLGSALEI